MPWPACVLRVRHAPDTRRSSGLQRRACCAVSGTTDGCRSNSPPACSMTTKNSEPVDDLLDALVWMRRKAKRHEAVDDLVDALVKMRRKAKKKVAQRTRSTKRR